MSENKNLGYLGVDYQYRLILQILTDYKFAETILDILKPNYFDIDVLRIIVREIKNAFDEDGTIPDIGSLEIRLLSKAKKESVKGIIKSTILKIKNTKLNDGEIIKKLAIRFCKEQEAKKLSIKLNKLIDSGEVNNIDIIENEFKKFLEIGEDKNDTKSVFENPEDALRDDYRDPIPTGIKGLDEIMNGGLSKGELGIILAPFGVGKAQPLNRKVMTINGWEEIGKLKIGDKIITPRNKISKINGIFPQGKRKVCKIIFNDNSSTECDISHLWKVYLDGKYVVINTEEIISLLNENKELFIPLCTNISLKEHNISNGSKEFYESLGKHIALNGYDFPESYIISHNLSLDEKIELVKGFIEQYKNGDEIYIDNSLSDETYNFFVNMVNSMGGIVLVEDTLSYKKLLKLVFRDSYMYNKIEYYGSGVDEFNMRKIVKVELLDKEKECVCISIDDEEKLYLTDDFIVTHNTTMLTKIANSCKNNGKNVLQVFFEDKLTEIQRKHYACWMGGKYELLELSNHRDEIIEVVNLMKAQPGNIVLKKMPSDRVTINNIRQLIRRLISKGFKPDMIVLDYIDCVSPSKDFKDEYSGEGSVMREFESLLSDFDIAGWTAVQGNRSSITSDVVQSNQMGGSIKKGQIGHFLLSIAKTLEQKEYNTATLAVLKSRFGKDGVVFEDIIFDNSRMIIDASKTNPITFLQTKENKSIKEKNIIKGLL
jgi:replicative DNA helicase